MPALTLPLTFANSFWSQDIRQGLETLYKKLEQGVEENDEIIAFIQARANAELALANALNSSKGRSSKGRGFDADEGASLLMAFRGLQSESAAQGQAHLTVSKELKDLVADPFALWAAGYKDRVYGSKNTVVDGWLRSYEFAQGEVDKLKHQFLAKVRRADEAADDAKFAPNTELADNLTLSPRLAPRERAPPQRTASVSERIAQRFKELQRKAVNVDKDTTTITTVFDEKTTVSEPDSKEGGTDEESKASPKVDKGKAKASDDVPAVLMSPPPMSPALPPPKVEIRGSSPVPPLPPPPILLAGLALPPAAVSDLLKRAAAEMPLRPVKFPIIGEYKDCFNGEDFVVWLVENVQGFGGSLDRAEEAARDLTERDGALRRVGEFGNAFENNEEAYYQFRPKAFTLAAEYAAKERHDSQEFITSPVIQNLAPVADNFMKRSNTLVNMVSKAINETRHSEPLHVRARAEADAADKAYRSAVRKLDRQRLGLEERLEDTLKTLQKWEIDRLRAVKTVLLQYQGTLANLPAGLQASNERSSALIASFQPEADLRALIERYRTGPFKPVAHVYESLTHEEADVYFGIDLRKWAEGGWNDLRSDQPPTDAIPEVLTAMLSALNAAYLKLPNDTEKRKSWIYEVPLSAVHHLRETLNAVPPAQPFPAELFAKYDAPVIASTVKLWALELDPPLGTWEGWDDIRRLYPSVGSKPEETNEQQHIMDLQVALQRLPKVHLLALEAIIGHITKLISATVVDEDNEVYITKLALSMGRNILRPKVENEISVQDRHPTMLLIDLLKHFDAVIPPAIAKKKRESDRKVPLRKRTAPVDLRMSRSRLSVANIDTREILEEQLYAKNPSMRPPSRAPSPNPQAQLQTQPTTAAVPQPTTEPTSTIAAPQPVPAVSAPAPVADVSSLPPMPTFKEPPPEAEDDYAPLPMPKFVEPPPEKEDDSFSPPPMPSKFAEPPVETDDRIVSPASPSSSPPLDSATSASLPVNVAPPTPRSSNSPSPSPARSRSPSTASITSRTGGGANLARSGSAETTRIRGPRGARRQGSNATGSVANISGLQRSGATSPSAASRAANRLSFQGGGRSPSPASVNPRDYEPKRRGARTQAGAFSRRGVTSDEEAGQ